MSTWFGFYDNDKTAIATLDEYLADKEQSYKFMTADSHICFGELSSYYDRKRPMYLLQKADTEIPLAYKLSDELNSMLSNIHVSVVKQYHVHVERTGYEGSYYKAVKKPGLDTQTYNLVEIWISSAYSDRAKYLLTLFFGTLVRFVDLNHFGHRVIDVHRNGCDSILEAVIKTSNKTSRTHESGFACFLEKEDILFFDDVDAVNDLYHTDLMDRNNPVYGNIMIRPFDSARVSSIVRVARLFQKKNNPTKEISIYA